MIDQSVADVMTRSCRTIEPEMTAHEVATLFAERKIGSAVVVTPDTGEVTGIVTESDIMQQVAAGADVNAVSASSFLSTPVITIASSESIRTAAKLMTEYSIRRLPVVDNGELLGILTTTDLTHYLPRLRQNILYERTTQLDQ